MDRAQLLALIDARAAADPAFAALVAAQDTQGMADALPPVESRPRSRMITRRGIVSALGLTAPPLLKALRAFAAGLLPSGDAIPVEHPLRPYVAVAAEVVPYLDGDDGVDLGDQLTQQLLGAMAEAGILDAQSVAALVALGTEQVRADEFAVRCAVYADDGSYLPAVI